uniref:DDE-1 domain-containing protein n=1 Tax=Acrobeloides nanus TaxID=290746 RepID=A0A914CTE5_9BILA
MLIHVTIAEFDLQNVKCNGNTEKCIRARSVSFSYAVWSILEEKACAKPHPTVESLKRALVKAWDEISVETLRKSVYDFPKRLKACVEAEGRHFE